ncbi:MAG: zinc ribbon domain-containing protein [Armatimonadetes bacterium]|nr:zinc ribbon domain-containing protein [Armatimonadota bacterium]
MPTYVYECSSCSETFESDQRITAKPLRDCRLCGAKGTVRRLVQPVAIHFKGSGFHVNDYSPKKRAEASGGKKADECSGDPSSCPACEPKE